MCGCHLYDLVQLIITNAHVVREATTVRVRRHGSSEKYTAEVLCMNHFRDLAVLTVKDASFWKDGLHLTISPTIPDLFENVVVVGFPMVCVEASCCFSCFVQVSRMFVGIYVLPPVFAFA